MIPKRAIDLILESEGVDQPSKWPEGESGITLGFGYDLGYCTAPELVADWSGILTAEEIALLRSAIGLRGEAAEKAAHRYRSIHVSRDQALKVFLNRTLPDEERKTRLAFPGCENLPGIAFGALVSLVYNRGTDMSGARRAEMRAIREVIERWRVHGCDLAHCLDVIAKQLRGMKRLWRGKGLDGLLTRRENEAALVIAANGSGQGDVPSGGQAIA